jgi:hypothetical protein
MNRAYAVFFLMVLLAIPAAVFGADADMPPATSLPMDAPIPIEPLAPKQPSLLGTDIVVSNLTGNEAEVTMDINPTNPLNMVVCGHAPGFGTMNTFYTLDGGQTWTLVQLGNADDGITSSFRFDPMVVFDAQGRVFVAYGVRNFDGMGNRQETVVVGRSVDGGQTYPQFTQVSTQASIGTLPGNDRWGIATGRDPVTAAQENVYVAWTQNVTESGSTDQRIVVSRSTDGGVTFSAPTIIADDAIAGNDRSLSADPGVGPNGEVYVAWHDFGDGQIVVDRSTDGGVTWGTDVVVHTLSFTGLFLTITPQPDRGVYAGPVLDVDESGGAFNGRVYIAYLDGPATDTNVFVRRSTDGGASWSGAVQPHDDGGTNSQFLPWMDVDQTSGRVSAIFYDARDDINDRTVHLYHAFSTDGGATFGANTRVSDNPSNQSTTNASRWTNNYLEYIGLTSWNCQAFAVWADCSANPGDMDYYFDSIPLGTASIACPADISVECTQHGGTPATDPAIAAFLNGASATDACGNAAAVTNNAPAVFPEGETVVTFTNASDNTVTCTAEVTIVDTTPPVIVCPSDIVVECSSHCGVANADMQLTPFFSGVSATDVCDDDVAITNDAPACFPLGETTVTFTATDDHGNTTQCAAKVTVQDTTPPEIDVVLDRDVLWPPNHKLATVCAAVTVTDICDPDPTWVLFGAESDEPDNSQGDGNTTDDIQNDMVGTADECIDLRSERMGGGDGRKYTIYYQAMDMSGNVAYDTVCVRVPHDQSSAALASTGFSPNGKTLTGASETFAVVIPTTDAVDAAELETSRIYLGNTAGVIRPAETRVVDVNADGRADLALFYRADVFDVLAGASSLDASASSGSSVKRERGDGPLGIHYTTRSGVDYLVGDIFALGAPVEMPGVWLDVTPPLVVAEVPDGPKATALSSIHPNPFNPQTTVAYTLVKSERVRIAIYDVRGSLVRRLVDDSQPAGSYQSVWTGADDAGRPVTSGIYFVRMIAGSYSETRKIVMLK